MQVHTFPFPVILILLFKEENEISLEKFHKLADKMKWTYFWNLLNLQVTKFSHQIHRLLHTISCQPNAVTRTPSIWYHFHVATQFVCSVCTPASFHRMTKTSTVIQSYAHDHPIFRRLPTNWNLSWYATHINCIKFYRLRCSSDFVR